MSKRNAVEELPGASSPLKKLHIDPDYVDDPNDVEDLDYVEGPPEDGLSSVQTPDSSTGGADSPATTATTPRAKFPSDLKTLACTWPGCTKTFNRPARLRDHLNSHTNSRPFKCPYDDCDKDYTVDKHLKQHVKAVHTHERRHVCQRDGCGKSFVTGTRLKRHQLVHEGADRFRCADCGQSFRKKDTLAKHIRKEHQGLRAHPCTETGCDAAFDSKTSLRRHCEREHGELRFWCDVCASAGGDEDQHRVGFTTELLLQAHLKREHQNCMFCDYRSKTQADIDRHAEIYHSGRSVEDRKTQICPYPGCSKRFTRQSNCNSHYRTAHQGLRYVCGELDLTGRGFEGWTNDQGCGAGFSAKARLEDHVRYVHLGHERPRLSSTAARKSKKMNEEAKAVVDEISGMPPKQAAEPPIACPQCPQTFLRYADLNAHIDSVHSLASNPLFNADMIDASGTADMFGGHGFAAPPFTEEGLLSADFHRDFPTQHNWAGEEANVLLLATGEPNHVVDPALL